MKVILFILILIISYELAKRITLHKIPSKIYKYLLDKNDKYYSDLLQYYDKNKKIKSTKKLNVIKRLCILINKTELRENPYFK